MRTVLVNREFTGVETGSGCNRAGDRHRGSVADSSPIDILYRLIQVPAARGAGKRYGHNAHCRNKSNKHSDQTHKHLPPRSTVELNCAIQQRAILSPFWLSLTAIWRVRIKEIGSSIR